MVRHHNNVGLLRLVFASLVIIGHAPEQIDGDNHRELLTVVFHTITLGELSVDAFFLLSGYLITMSMVQSKSLRTYLERRVLRIYPAYLMAFVLCIFALGPFVGERPWEHLPQTIGRALLLREPADYPGQLLGLPIPSLNGSMWTIAHEFRCYLLVAALGTVGLLARRRIILALAVTAAAATIVGTFPPVSTGLDHLRTHPRIVALVIGDPWSALRLTTAFMAGSVGYLYRAEIASRLNSWVALGLSLIHI